MLDHVTIGVSNIERSKTFYDRALRPLGIERLYAEGQTFAGYGADRKAFFWIGLREASQASTHVAFTAQDRETVEQFHRAALAAGGFCLINTTAYNQISQESCRCHRPLKP